MGCNRLFSVPPASPNLLKLHTLLHSNPWGAAKIFSMKLRHLAPHAKALKLNHLNMDEVSGWAFSRSTRKSVLQCRLGSQLSAGFDFFSNLSLRRDPNHIERCSGSQPDVLQIWNRA